MSKIIFDRVCGNCICYSWKKKKCKNTMLNKPFDEPGCGMHIYKKEGKNNV